MFFGNVKLKQVIHYYLNEIIRVIADFNVRY